MLETFKRAVSSAMRNLELLAVAVFCWVIMPAVLVVGMGPIAELASGAWTVTRVAMLVILLGCATLAVGFIVALSKVVFTKWR